MSVNRNGCITKIVIVAHAAIVAPMEARVLPDNNVGERDNERGGGGAAADSPRMRKRSAR